MKRNLRRNARTAASKGTPGLHGRPLGVMLGYINFTAVLPTRLMFGVAWRHLTKRVIHVWEDKKWMQYFGKFYMHSAKINDESVPGAKWHYGVASLLHRGHPPSPQPVEQQNAALKGMVRSLRKNADLCALLDAFRSQIAAWCGPPENVEKSYSLLAPRSRMTTSAPSQPDDWMMQTSKHTLYVLCESKNIRVAPLPEWLQKCREPGQQVFKTWRSEGANGRTYYILGCYAPVDIPDDVPLQCAQQLRAGNVQELQDLWLAQVTPSHPEFPNQSLNRSFRYGVTECRCEFHKRDHVPRIA